jgi:hypothetical protein
VCRSKYVEPSENFEIINSITKLHLVGISTESSAMYGSMSFTKKNYGMIFSTLSGPKIRVLSYMAKGMKSGTV